MVWHPDIKEDIELANNPKETKHNNAINNSFPFQSTSINLENKNFKSNLKFKNNKYRHFKNIYRSKELVFVNKSYHQNMEYKTNHQEENINIFQLEINGNHRENHNQLYNSSIVFDNSNNTTNVGNIREKRIYIIEGILFGNIIEKEEYDREIRFGMEWIHIFQEDLNHK